MSTATGFIYHTETINDEEIQKPSPKRLLIQARLQRWLEDQSEGRAFEVLPELDMLCGNDRYVPDILVVRQDAAYRNDMLADAPVLAIEIMSPGQTIGRLFEKCEAYLLHGVAVCWVIWPERRQAWWYTRNELVEVSGPGQSLEAQSAELLLKVPSAELFANLPPANTL